VLGQALEAGVRMVQIREKDLDARKLIDLAQHLIPLIKQHQGTVLVNDRVDIALALDADGVHLRSDSLPLPVARRVLGGNRLIGLSVHSAEEVRYAENEGADFVVLGPIFETPSKEPYGPPLGLHILETACRENRLPIFAIGGIKAKHIPSVMSSGAYGITVISSILQAPDIQNSTLDLLSQLP
jgi:thiamine-phosphate pyrophosphorylase